MRLYLAITSFLTLFTHSQVQAAYPERPVRIITSAPLGAQVDQVARVVAEKMSVLLEKPIFVENKPGSLGELAVGELLRAAPDGYTILIAPDGSMSTMPASYQNGAPAPYDPRAITPIGKIANSYFVLVVSSDLPVRTVRELVEYGQANPGKLNFASGNPSGTLGIALLNLRGANITEIRNFREGEPGGHREILGGIVHGMFSTMTTAVPYIDNGQERALALFQANPSRKIPSMRAEGLPEFEPLVTWSAVFAPPGISQEIVQKLNATLNDALRDPTVRRKIEQLGVTVSPTSPDELGALVKKQYELLKDVFKRTGIKLR